MNTTWKRNFNNQDNFDQVMGKSHDFQFCVHIFDKARRKDVVAGPLQH